MKTPLKLQHMETGELLVASIASIGTVSIAGVTAIIRQAITNTTLKARLDAVESERTEIHEIKKAVIDIQISNAKYFTILEANQKNLEANQANLAILTKSVSLIHQIIDTISRP